MSSQKCLTEEYNRKLTNFKWEIINYSEMTTKGTIG